MKINITNEFKKNTLLSSIVLNGITDAIVNSLTNIDGEGAIADVVLTINGQDLDLCSFVEHWQSQVSRMIAEHAKELAEEKLADVYERFADVYELLGDLESRLKDEINNRLEDWERSGD